MITEAGTGVMQTQARTPGAPRARGGSSESSRRKLRLDNSDVRIHFSYSKAHTFGQQQYPPETNTENDKKGKDEEFFSDNCKSRWIN